MGAIIARYVPIRKLLVLLCFLSINQICLSQDRAFFDSSFAPFKDKYPIESVYLHIDKYKCLAGDSIWWKAYIIDGNGKSTISTNLFVELFSNDEELICREVFPIIQSFSVGQMRIPDSLRTGRYWLRAYTRYQLNFDRSKLFIAPITVYNVHDPKPVKIAERRDPDPEPSTSVIDNMLWVSHAAETNLTCLLDADSSANWYNKTLNVVVMSYHKPICQATLALTKERPWRDFTMPFNIALNGFVDVLLWADSTFVGLESLFIPQKQVSTISVTPDTLGLHSSAYNSGKVDFDDTILYLSRICQKC